MARRGNWRGGDLGQRGTFPAAFNSVLAIGDARLAVGRKSHG
jgi:hypothetical protein